jgi:hypothetical protein
MYYDEGIKNELILKNAFFYLTQNDIREIKSVLNDADNASRSEVLHDNEPGNFSGIM